MRPVVVIALLAGCTSFDAIDRNVCGNGLLEPGEDCDSDDASCSSCSVVCAVPGDCPAPDYTCGVDGLCHAPGGALGQPTTSPGTFQSHELQVSDVDHDGIGDVLGLSQTSIVVRHGDPAATLAAEDSLLTPAQTGPAAFGDLDGDGSLDLTLTTLDGLVSYTSPYGELAPLAVQSVVLDGMTGQPLDIRQLVHVDDDVFAGFIVDPVTNYVFFFTVDMHNPAGPIGKFTSPCALPVPASELDPKNVEVYQVNRDDSQQLDTVVAMLAGSGTTRRLCALALHRDAPGFGAYPQFVFTNITPAGAPPAKLPLFADLDADTDRCPGLVNRDGGPKQLTWWDGVMGSTGCTLAASAPLPAIADAPAGADVIGHVPVDPPALLAASDGLATSEGGYVYIPVIAYYLPVYHTTRKLAFVVGGRIDTDDHVDAVAVAEGSDDLDLLYRVPNEAGFQLLRLDTASEVTSVTLGDYDGNGITDIAFTERQQDHDRLMIAYGTLDRPLPPVAVGAFPDVVSVTRMQFKDSIDYLGIDGDLVVIGPPLPGQTTYRMTLLHGSAQRTMLSYFDPRQTMLRDETLFRGAIIGHFAADPTYEDVVAMAPARTNMTVAPNVRAWRVPGTVDGLDATKTPGIEVTGVVDCSTTASALLCLDDARYLAFPTAPSHDIVVGIDSGRRAISIDPWSTANPIAAVSLAALAAKFPAGTIPHSLHAADLDGDGNAELIAAFAPITPLAVGAIVVCDSTLQSCDDLVPAIQEAAGALGESVDHCFDATTARVPTTDVVAVCRGTTTSIYRVHREAGVDHVTRLATTSAFVTQLRAGDVTGDGVDDIVVVAGDAVKSLVIYPQCTSRDLVCIGGGS